MLRSELNDYWIQIILYYCYMQDSNQLFDANGSDVGSWGYDNGDLYIIAWYPGTITEPTIQNLLDMNKNDAISFYANFYTIPSDIANMQPFYNISSTTLAEIHVTSAFTGYIIFNTTTQKLQYYDGTSWNNLY